MFEVEAWAVLLIRNRVHRFIICIVSLSTVEGGHCRVQVLSSLIALFGSKKNKVHERFLRSLDELPCVNYKILAHFTHVTILAQFAHNSRSIHAQFTQNTILAQFSQGPRANNAQFSHNIIIMIVFD